MASDDPGNRPRPSSGDLSCRGEDGLIQKLREAARSADPQVIKGIGDDAAVIVSGVKTLVTTDLLIEDVHFRLPKTPPRRLGRKALGVNLSDIAAMAGTPRFALLGLACPPSFSTQLLDEIMAGFFERAKEAEVTLIGGDVVRGEKLALAVTVIGEATPPGPVYRSGARPGDLIFVTGTVGDSALGLMRLNQLIEPVTEELIAADPLSGPILRHLDPPARIAMGKRLAGVATAMMDLSDGIMSDLGRLLEESGGLGAEIETDKLPLSPAFREHFGIKAEVGGRALWAALAGGEDYELIFTAPAADESRLMKIGADEGLGITRIGVAKPEPGVRLMDSAGHEVVAPAAGFEHFSEEGEVP